MLVQIQKNQIEELINEGFSIKEISKRLNTPITKIKKACKYFNIDYKDNIFKNIEIDEKLFF